MKNNFTQEIGVAALLIVVLILLINPFHVWMPSMMLITILSAIVIIFGIFASFILREQVSDEREGIHRMLAGRSAFLAGSSTLIIGILVQSFTHVDVWLVLALVAMIVAKICTRVYTDKNY